MLFQSIASGSNGNCSVLSTEQGSILIDAGISRKRVIQGLKDLKINPSSISHILITHAHSDHVSGLPVLHDFLPKAKVVATPKTIGELEKLKRRDRRYKLVAKNAIAINPYDPVDFNTFEITTFNTKHDISGSSSYKILHYNSEKIVSYATDTGDINPLFYKAMKESQIIFLESNFDNEMLQTSKRPFWLKKRIQETHLSNEKYIKTIERVVNKNTECVISGHISGECNRPEVVAKLKRKHLVNKVDWMVCSRFERSPTLNINENQVRIVGGLNSYSDIENLESPLDKYFK